jgi:hypothetical protein
MSEEALRRWYWAGVIVSALALWVPWLLAGWAAVGCDDGATGSGKSVGPRGQMSKVLWGPVPVGHRCVGGVRPGSQDYTTAPTPEMRLC